MNKKGLRRLIVAMCSVAMLFTGIMFTMPQNTNAVYAVGGSAETWVFNDDIGSDSIVDEEIDFISNETSYGRLVFSGGELTYYYYVAEEEVWGHDGLAYDDAEGEWSNSAYKTITLSTAATGNFKTFLEAHATKQQSQDSGTGTVPSTGIYFDNAMMIGSGCVMISSLGLLTVLIIKRKKFN